MTTINEQETDILRAVDVWTEARDYCTTNQFLEAHPNIQNNDDNRREIARALKHFGYVRGFIRHAKLGA